MSATISIRRRLLAATAIATMSGLPAAAQKTTGTPGSPGATTTFAATFATIALANDTQTRFGCA